MKKFLVIFFLISGMFGSINTVKAETETNMDNISKTFCRAINFFTGSIGKTIAVIAIIALGVGFFGGKVSWPVLLTMCLAIATMFGAPTIVARITGDTELDCSNVDQ